MEVDRHQDVIRVVGANVYITDGTGSTFGDDAPNGLGNLLIGYGETTGLGSHNLIVGRDHAARGRGSAVFGVGNFATADGASILGGQGNIASGEHSVILGGYDHEVTEDYAVGPCTCD